MTARNVTEPAVLEPSTRPGHELGWLERAVLLLAGTASFAVGCAAIFTVDGSGGAGGAALLAVGVAVLWIASIGVLPGTLKVAGVELSLPEKVQRLEQEARRQGRPDVASALSVGAQLAATAEPFSQVYELIRTIARSGDHRTTALDALVRVVEQETRDGRWSMAEARALFESGHPGARVFALAMMRGNPRREEADLALDAIVRPQSKFEQWHGLTAMEGMLPHLDGEWLERLGATLSKVDLDDRSTARAELRDKILQRVADRRSANQARSGQPGTGEPLT